jgi:hypothetical protein
MGLALITLIATFFAHENPRQTNVRVIRRRTTAAGLAKDVTPMLGVGEDSVPTAILEC